MYYLIYCNLNTITINDMELSEKLLDYADKIHRLDERVWIAYIQELTPFNDLSILPDELMRAQICTTESDFIIIPLEECYGLLSSAETVFFNS